MNLQLIGYIAFGKTKEGERVPLREYMCDSKDAVESKIIRIARAEGYNGTLSERMKELGWWIELVYAKGE